MKVCSKCKVEKDESEYYKKKSNADGLQGNCKSCINKYISEYKKLNPEKKAEWTKKSSGNYSSNNKEKIKNSLKKWRKENPDKVSEQNKRNSASKQAWAKKNAKYDGKYHKDRYTDPIHNKYLLDLLTRQGFKRDYLLLNPDVMEVHKQIIKIKRLCKEESHQ